MMNKWLAAALLALTLQAHADMELRYRDAEGEHRMLARPGMVRMELPGQSGYLIFLAGKKQLYMVNPDQKEYVLIDQVGVNRLANTLNQAMEQMQAQLAALPPEQRAQMAQLMGGLNPQENAQMRFEMRATGRSGNNPVAGTCQWHRMRFNGQPVGEACLAPVADLGVAEADVQALDDMFAFMEQMLSRLPMIQDDPLSFGAHKAGMLPVMFLGADGGKEGELVSLKRNALEPALFQPPAGYQQRRIDEAMQR